MKAKSAFSTVLRRGSESQRLEATPWRLTVVAVYFPDDVLNDMINDVKYTNTLFLATTGSYFYCKSSHDAISDDESPPPLIALQLQGQL